MSEMITPRLKRLHENLRRHESPIEEMMGAALTSPGVPFKPQEPIGPYFADIYLPNEKVVIECDGADWHDPAYDAKRDAYMRGLGLQVFRVTGKAIVRSAIKEAVKIMYAMTGDDARAKPSTFEPEVCPFPNCATCVRRSRWEDDGDIEGE